jgi:hypothetical protein
MTKDFYFNTQEALDKAKADRDKPVTPVEYKPVISDAGADSNMLWPDTMYGLLPKGTGKITLHESKPAQQEPVALVIDGVLVKSSLPEKYTGHLYTTPPAQPAPVQEPVAWRVKVETKLRDGSVDSGYQLRNERLSAYDEPLYTTPPTAQPAVPDALFRHAPEHPQYIEGWNDCRAEMMKGMKP